jgi:hypothetical protein
MRDEAARNFPSPTPNTRPNAKGAATDALYKAQARSEQTNNKQITLRCSFRFEQITRRDTITAPIRRAAHDLDIARSSNPSHVVKTWLRLTHSPTTVLLA